MVKARPLPAGTYSITAGWRYRHRRPSDHFAYDLAAPVGTRVYSLTSGVVVACHDGEWDNFTHGVGGPFPGKDSNYVVVEFRHDGRQHYAYYQHLRRGLRVQRGDRVTAGQHIAAVGLTGNTSGPHLHLAVANHGYDGDRYSYMRGDGAGAVFPPTSVAEEVARATRAGGPASRSAAPRRRGGAVPRVAVADVQPGKRGSAVLVVQKALAKVVSGFDFSSGPGVFGPLTTDAYRRWQESLYGPGDDADGRPGRSSLRALGRRTGLFTV